MMPHLYLGSELDCWLMQIGIEEILRNLLSSLIHELLYLAVCSPNKYYQKGVEQSRLVLKCIQESRSYGFKVNTSIVVIITAIIAGESKYNKLNR